MNLTTPVPIARNSVQIDYNSSIVAFGSCFAENMSQKWDYYKFENSVNPFGILFNAVSLAQILHRVANSVFFTERDIFFHNQLWHCYEVHSDLSHPNKEEFLEILNQKLTKTKIQLQLGTHVLITYGTSWVYRNIPTLLVVANCHKMPQKQFSKELVTVAETQEAIQKSLSSLYMINKNLKIIFTISPVRHLKDGFVENNVSKSILLTSVYQTLTQEPNSTYFPSYEILMDELRDYRFYNPDLLHPSAIAIDYIWEKFVQAFVLEVAYPVMTEIENIQKMLSHKILNIHNFENQEFKIKIQNKINHLRDRFPQFEF